MANRSVRQLEEDVPYWKDKVQEGERELERAKQAVITAEQKIKESKHNFETRTCELAEAKKAKEEKEKSSKK